MIEAKYCGCVTKSIQPLFTIATQLLSQHLGIDGYNATIQFHLDRPKMEIGEDGELRTVGGSMEPATTEENALRIDAKLPPKQYDIHIAVDKPDIMMFSFAHEMLHVQQWLTGTLSAKTLWKKNTVEARRLYYYGTQVELDKTKYDDLPWEKDAHRDMFDLGIWLIKALDKHWEKIREETKKLLGEAEYAKLMKGAPKAFQ